MLPHWDLSHVFHDALKEHLSVVTHFESQDAVLMHAAARISKAVLSGKKVLWCGNGGSAADAQHLAAELVGRFKSDRRALASIALTTDSSVLTAVANDFGYEHVFARQVEALCCPGDVVVGISTSGGSMNVCHALGVARRLGAFAIALTGAQKGPVADVADLCIHVPSRNTARIQEAHILCGHMLCEWVERAISRPGLELVRGTAQ